MTRSVLFHLRPHGKDGVLGRSVGGKDGVLGRNVVVAILDHRSSNGFDPAKADCIVKTGFDAKVRTYKCWNDADATRAMASGCRCWCA
jgi:hypothetical protein